MTALLKPVGEASVSILPSFTAGVPVLFFLESVLGM